MYYLSGRAFLNAGNIEEAEKAFQSGLAENDVKCLYGMIKVSIAKDDGEGLNLYIRLLSERFNELEILFGQGDENASFVLGSCFENGWCVERDLDKAMYYYMRIAEKNPLAQFNLGCIFLSPQKRSLKEAAFWFTKAAESGDVEALYNLGYCYLQTDGAENLEKARNCFIKACEKGDIHAEEALKLYFTEEV